MMDTTIMLLSLLASPLSATSQSINVCTRPFTVQPPLVSDDSIACGIAKQIKEDQLRDAEERLVMGCTPNSMPPLTDIPPGSNVSAWTKCFGLGDGSQLSMVGESPAPGIHIGLCMLPLIIVPPLIAHDPFACRITKEIREIQLKDARDRATVGCPVQVPTGMSLGSDPAAWNECFHP
ncbi:MAG: hypothetical protein HY537_04640 [Deltaproteobacteria bacterium]|nr:hypothetical protein [Deltaproteobacteria bacterium]